MNKDDLKYRKHSLLRYHERFCRRYKNEVSDKDRVFLIRIKLDYDGLKEGTTAYRLCDNHTYERCEIPEGISDFFLRAYSNGRKKEDITDELLVAKIEKKQKKYLRFGIETFVTVYRSFYVLFDVTSDYSVSQTLYEVENQFENPNPIRISAKRYSETIGPNNCR